MSIFKMITNIQFVSFINHYGPCKSVNTIFIKKQFPQKSVSSRKINLIEFSSFIGVHGIF